MSKKRGPHFHKYERMEWPNGNAFYKCMMSGCSHYLPTLVLAIGRESVCWICNVRLVEITKEMISEKIKHPVCDKCKEERKERRAALIGIVEEE